MLQKLELGIDVGQITTAQDANAAIAGALVYYHKPNGDSGSDKPDDALPLHPNPKPPWSGLPNPPWPLSDELPGALHPLDGRVKSHTCLDAYDQEVKGIGKSFEDFSFSVLGSPVEIKIG